MDAANWASDKSRYDQLMGLQQLMTQTAQQTAAEEFEQGRGMRQAERGSKESNFLLEQMINNQARNTPGYAPAMIGGKMGTAQEQQVKGQVALGTQDSTIGTKNTENLVRGLENASRYMEIAATNNPTMAQAGYMQLLEKLPPQLRQRFPSQYTPEVPKMLQALSDTIKNSPEHRRTMEKTRVERDSAEAVGRGNNAATIQAAQIGADSRTAIAQARLQQFLSSNKMNFQQFLTQFAQKKAAGQATPQDELMAQMIEQMMYQARISGTGSVDPNAGLPVVFPEVTARPRPESAIPGTKQPELGTKENPIPLD